MFIDKHISTRARRYFPLSIIEDWTSALRTWENPRRLYKADPKGNLNVDLKLHNHIERLLQGYSCFNIDMNTTFYPKSPPSSIANVCFVATLCRL
jgi:hypothetical protein